MTPSELRKYLAGNTFLIQNLKGIFSFYDTNARVYPKAAKQDMVPWNFIPVPDALNKNGDLYYITNLWQGRNPLIMDRRYGNTLSFSGNNVNLAPNESIDLVQWQVINNGYWIGGQPIINILNQWASGSPTDPRFNSFVAAEDGSDPTSNIVLSPTGDIKTDKQWYLEPFSY